MAKNEWTWTRTTALAALIAIAFLVTMWGAENGHLLFAWSFVLAALLVFTFICGQGITGQWMGALIDERNVMSLARFQMVAWTILILSAYLTAALSNIYTGQADPLAISLPKELWVLMGISTTSLVGSPLIMSTKAGRAPNAAETARTFDLLAQQGDTQATLTTKGQMVANTESKLARFSDMFTGEEVGNAAHLDITRLQMFFFTLVTLLAYAVMLAHMFGAHAGGMIAELKALDQSMVALIAISHTGYLAAKAAPHSQLASSAAAPGPQGAVVGDHPAMG